METGIGLVKMRQTDDLVQVDLDLDPAAVAGPWRLELFAFPVVFNELGVPEGPVRTLGEASGPGPFTFSIPTDLPYGPYTLTGMVHDQQGPWGLTDAIGLVLRDLRPAYGVTLKREAVGTGVQAVQDLTGYRVRIRALEAKGLPRALFLFRENRDGVGRMADEFLGVCRPADLLDYPEGRPAGLNGKYRLDVIDIVTHHADELETLWTTVDRDVAILVKTLEACRRLSSVAVSCR